jgi:hypothetical protein
MSATARGKRLVLVCIADFLLPARSFYTRLFKIKDPVTGLPIFAQLQVSLACNACKELGLAAQCKHMLHLVPEWQSSIRHERLKAVMADRPDLIQSELAGLAFDALQQCFRTQDIDTFMSAAVLPFVWRQNIFIVIDPAAGGPASDFALISFTKQKGIITVSAFQERTYSILRSRSKSMRGIDSSTKKAGMMW